MSLREQLAHKAGAASSFPNPFYATRAQGAFLRVEASDGVVSLLPWLHLVFARLETGERDRLVLMFVSHEVTVHGLSLGELLSELEAQRLERLRAAPGKYLKAADGEPSIEQICVRQLSEPMVSV